MQDKQTEIAELERSWEDDKRWDGIERPYKAEDVLRLRGSVKIEHTLARIGAEVLLGFCGHLRHGVHRGAGRTAPSRADRTAAPGE